MSAVRKKFHNFQVEPQPQAVRHGDGPTVSHKALGCGYLQGRARRGRKKAEANGQSPEDMISDLLDKAASDG